MSVLYFNFINEALIEKMLQSEVDLSSAVARTTVIVSEPLNLYGSSYEGVEFNLLPFFCHFFF
jgi:hypothetical protein